MAILTSSLTAAAQLGVLILVLVGERIVPVSGKYVNDGAPSFQAMQSIAPFIKTVFANISWEESVIAMTADEAFEHFLTNSDSTVLFAGRNMLPSDYVNAGCSCASEGCSEEVLNGNALITCNDVTPLKFELTAERSALIVNKEVQTNNFTYEEMLAYYSSGEPISCSELGGDASKTVSFYLPSDATAVGYRFHKYLESGSYEDVTSGSAVTIEPSFDDIIQRVGSDECAIGIVPYAMAKDCGKHADSIFAQAVCGNLKIAKIDGVVCDVCPPTGSTYALDTPILMYINTNTVGQNAEVDFVLEMILQKAIDYNFDLFNTLPELKTNAVLSAQRSGCAQMNTFTTNSFEPPANLNRYCDTILCCYQADGCESDWYYSTFHFNLTAMFTHSPCPECQQQAHVNNIKSEVCTINWPECTVDIMEHCWPWVTTAPVTICLMCGYPNDYATERVCMQTYVYYDIHFDCVDKDNQVLTDLDETIVDPCARGDCSILTLDLDFITDTLSCIPT